MKIPKITRNDLARIVGWNPRLYTEQMDAEGLGRKLLLTPPATPNNP